MPDSQRENAQAELLTVVDSVLRQARAKGADAAEASANSGQALSITVRKGELENVDHHRDKSLAVVVFRGQRKGSATTTDFTAAALERTVDAALAAANYTGEDPYAGLADPAELARQPLPDLDLYHPWDVDVGTAQALATACEQAALGYDPRITNTEGSTFSSQRGYQAYGNSLGFAGAYAATSHNLSCSVIARDGDNMERDHDYTVARLHTAMATPEHVGTRAAQRAVARLGARQIATCKAPVLFEAPLASGLFGHFIGAISGGAQYRQASFLLDAIGQQVFPEWLSLREDPFIPRGVASVPFDMDGVAPQQRTLIEGGQLQDYVMDVYSARRLQRRSTGNAGGVHNLIVTTSDRSLEDMLALMGTGLLVSELIGFGVNGVTGDYSRGAAGFWVENGRIAYPVHEITIAGQLRDMYRGIVAIGGDIDPRRAVQSGSVLLENLTIAGA
ncbi:MAG: metalloprotease PmbA [Gammaproteobacteria bacterium]|nr:metalloprotease PmbA [Gammaproteobacteria bacterium]